MKSRSMRRAALRQAEEEDRKAERPERTPSGSTPVVRGEERSAQGDSLPIVRGQQTPHALTGNFKVMEFESQEAFDELRDALRAEHRPATPTEIVLVDRIAEHIWLSQRAQKFADLAFLDHSEKMMALMLRYRTTHDRAFHKCLAELRILRKERRKEREEFESQTLESPQKPVTIATTGNRQGHEPSHQMAAISELEWQTVPEPLRKTGASGYPVWHG